VNNWQFLVSTAILPFLGWAWYAVRKKRKMGFV
jgi:hypothetical protein